MSHEENREREMSSGFGGSAAKTAWVVQETKGAAETHGGRICEVC